MPLKIDGKSLTLGIIEKFIKENQKVDMIYEKGSKQLIKYTIKKECDIF